MSPRVAIVYLAYNSKPYLDEVVASVERLNYPKEQIEFIIVDNNSPDGSAEVIRENILPKSGQSLPKVTFFPNPTNEGFSQGNNIGVNHALLALQQVQGDPEQGRRVEGFDYVYLLNNDAKFHPDAITEAVRLAESDQTIGSVQSLMLLWKQPEIVNSTGGMVHFLGFGFVRDNGRPRSEITIKDGEAITYASGAAVLYRASILREVGLLDPFYFLYHEDLELGWRIRLHGYRNVFALKSVVYHNYEFKRSVQKFYWMERNRLLVHARHLRLPTLLLLLPWALVVELALLVLSFKGGWTKEKLRSYGAFFLPKTWRHLREKRKESRLLRRCTDREIVRLWTGKIEHQETKSWVVDRFANPILNIVWSVLKMIIVW